MKVSAGALLILLGIGHTFAGIWFGQEALIDITRSGWVNSVTPQQPERMAVIWFLLAGFFMMLLGESLRWIERQSPVPARIGWTLLAIGIIAAVYFGANIIGLVIGLSLIVPATIIEAWRSRPPIDPNAPRLAADDPSWDRWNPWLARENEEIDESDREIQ